MFSEYLFGEYIYKLYKQTIYLKKNVFSKNTMYRIFYAVYYVPILNLIRFVCF